MKKNWWSKNIENWKTYIRSYNEGIDFPSRKWLANFLKIHGVKSVVDVGCGGGIDLEQYRKDGYVGEYLGVDYTPEAIETCKEMFPNEKFAVADARFLSAVLEQNSYEVVTIRHTLDHIDNWQAALESAYKVASRFVVIVLWVPPEKETFTEKGDDGYYRTFELEKLIGWIDETLLPKNIEHLAIPATGVPGREYRVDTAIIITK